MARNTITPHFKHTTMKIISKLFLCAFGLCLICSCDAETLDGSLNADGDDGVILENPYGPEDRNGDGIPNLPESPL